MAVTGPDWEQDFAAYVAARSRLLCTTAYLLCGDWHRAEDHTQTAGGIRSGKSEFAEALLSASEQVSYLATAPVREDDGAWDKRVALHRERRPADWNGRHR